ncbi:related to Co-chaperone protein HscB, mitochondrial precursor [Sporisorium reilianum SRZ2]|uniref:Related to Co-chaperone protein HscB, mitochondrial n=1 Tax=Sporisorium reilianum (strain SRZ2) TaxID=999809 RepID=E6ZRS6_SPORE|nr:related to Co-chaperone protein HscB, mitochondrial precursor [Sporisorium reilianum SRZ2]
MIAVGITRAAVRPVAANAARSASRRSVAVRTLALSSRSPASLRTKIAATPSRRITPATSTRFTYSTSSSAASTPLKSCPNCSEPQPLESLSCPKCNTLQPLPSDIDFYKAMDLDLSAVPQGGWAVDASALKRAWRLKMAVTHPDRMVGRTDKEQQIGAQQSALINRAYETLLHPLARAHYLLERYNAPEVGESDSLEDPELLMEVMELRERLEEAESEHEAAEVGADNAKLLDASVAALARAFGENPPDLEAAREAAVQLRYWTNIEKAAREWSPGKRVELQH